DAFHKAWQALGTMIEPERKRNRPIATPKAVDPITYCGTLLSGCAKSGSMIGTAKCHKPNARLVQMTVLAGENPARSQLPHNAPRKKPSSVTSASTKVTRKFKVRRLNAVVAE